MNFRFALSLAVAVLTLSSVSHAAGPQFDLAKMKKTAIEKFLKQANDKNSELGKAIIKINEESKDGRNDAGSIAFPIKESALQAVIVDGTEMYNPWHYAHEEKGFCVAEGNTVRILILLDQFLGVHNAQEFTTARFTVHSTEMMSAKIIKKDPKDFFCQDIGMPSSETKSVFGKVRTVISVSNPVIALVKSQDE